MDLGAVGIEQHFAAIELAPQLGVSKPDPRFFASVAERASVEPATMLVVGDRVDNDYEPTRAAGMHALVIDRRSRVEDPSIARIETLTEVVELVRLPGADSAAGLPHHVPDLRQRPQAVSVRWRSTNSWASSGREGSARS